VDPHPALLARAAHEELRERQMRGVRAPDVAPSRQTAPAEVASRQQLALDFMTPSAKPTAAVAKRTEPNRPGPAPSEAAEIGTAMHSYLALVDLSRETVDEELIRQLPHAGEIRDMAEQYHGSELRARLAAAAALRREVPLTFVDDGAIVHGVVDLIVEESDGSTTVLDWKTDRLEMTEPEERAEIYRSQLTSYGRGIQLAMGLKKAPETVVHFLRDNVTIGL
jgi:ATP-dependent helicase/nuclease subunit A